MLQDADGQPVTAVVDCSRCRRTGSRSTTTPSMRKSLKSRCPSRSSSRRADLLDGPGPGPPPGRARLRLPAGVRGRRHARHVVLRLVRPPPGLTAMGLFPSPPRTPSQPATASGIPPDRRGRCRPPTRSQRPCSMRADGVRRPRVAAPESPSTTIAAPVARRPLARDAYGVSRGRPASRSACVSRRPDRARPVPRRSGAGIEASRGPRSRGPSMRLPRPAARGRRRCRRRATCGRSTAVRGGPGARRLPHRLELGALGSSSALRGWLRRVSDGDRDQGRGTTRSSGLPVATATAQALRALSGRVVPEAALGLAAEVAGGDQVLEQRRRGEAGLAELQVELALDRQRDVVADHVEQLERPHRQRAALLHRQVDVVGGGVVRLEHLHRVVEVGEQQRVDDEAGPVAARDRRPCRPSRTAPGWSR